jgi:hypothetical protein
MLAMLQSPPPPIKLSLHRLAFRDYIKESLEKQEVFQNFSAFFAYFLPHSFIVDMRGKTHNILFIKTAAFIMSRTEKSPSFTDRLVSGNFKIKLHSAGDLIFVYCADNLAAAQATSADVNMLGASVHDGLDALHIGLPCTVGSSVGVADLDAEGNALITKFALCH